MSINLTYEFSAPVWKHSATGGWYFVSLPIEFSEEIRQNIKWQVNTYILPVKADIRKKEKIEIGNILDVEITL